MFNIYFFFLTSVFLNQISELHKPPPSNISKYDLFNIEQDFLCEILDGLIEDSWRGSYFP